MTKKFSLMQSSLIGVAGNAPSYSVAVTTGTLAATLGDMSALAMIYCGFVILGIMFAYKKLNQDQPSCGAAYTWVSRIIHPVFGFYAGWCLLIASVLFMVAATLPAGKAALLLFNPTLADDKLAVAIVAIIFLVLMTVAVVRGVDVVGKLQAVLTTLELSAIAIVAIAVTLTSGTLLLESVAKGLQLEKLSLNFFSQGLVIAIFFYWGWDVIFNISEETEDTRKASGVAGVIAVVLLIVIFTFYALAASALLTEEDIKKAGDNTLFALASKALPHPFNYIAIVAFLLSTIGAMEASLLQFSRTVLAKARDGALSKTLARIHPEWKTPVFAIGLNFVIVLVLLAFSLLNTTVEEAVLAAIGASGILVTYYYALAGIACATHYHRNRLSSFVQNVLYVYWPIVSVIIFITAAVLATTQFNSLATGSVLLSLVLGAVVAFIHRDAFKKAVE